MGGCQMLSSGSPMYAAAWKKGNRFRTSPHDLYFKTCIPHLAETIGAWVQQCPAQNGVHRSRPVFPCSPCPNLVTSALHGDASSCVSAHRHGITPRQSKYRLNMTVKTLIRFSFCAAKIRSLSCNLVANIPFLACSLLYFSTCTEQEADKFRDGNRRFFLQTSRIS